MALCISRIRAVEILDSRSRPTLSITLVTKSGTGYWAGVPSGASTGSLEATERRDGDSDRYGGLGVLGAVEAVNEEIAAELCGRSFLDLGQLDETLIALDGTETKSRLGANAVVGVSMASARAFAAEAGLQLWQSLAGRVADPRLPVPHFNVLNGGVHAANALDFQEFMIAPLGAPSETEAVRAGSEVYGALRRRLISEKLAVGLGDEGGFAPELRRPEDALALLVEAIEEAGYRAGRDGIAIAIDPASSQFFAGGRYEVAGESLTSDEMIELYTELVARFPIWLIEDGLAESDWDGWERLTQQLGEQVELVGDDIYCTNPAIITKAISRRAGNAALIKLNQIGTVSEALEAMRLCRDAGFPQFVSHRSGETEDSFIADLAVGTGCGHMKSGAPARGERVAKYNRLLSIEDEFPHLPYGLV